MREGGARSPPYRPVRPNYLAASRSVATHPRHWIGPLPPRPTDGLLEPRTVHARQGCSEAASDRWGGVRETRAELQPFLPIRFRQDLANLLPLDPRLLPPAHRVSIMSV